MVYTSNVRHSCFKGSLDPGGPLSMKMADLMVAGIETNNEKSNTMPKEAT